MGFYWISVFLPVRFSLSREMILQETCVYDITNPCFQSSSFWLWKWGRWKDVFVGALASLYSAMRRESCWLRGRAAAVHREMSRGQFGATTCSGFSRFVQCKDVHFKLAHSVSVSRSVAGQPGQIMMLSIERETLPCDGPVIIAEGNYNPGFN